MNLRIDLPGLEPVKDDEVFVYGMGGGNVYSGKYTNQGHILNKEMAENEISIAAINEWLSCFNVEKEVIHVTMLIQRPADELFEKPSKGESPINQNKPAAHKPKYSLIDSIFYVLQSRFNAEIPKSSIVAYTQACGVSLSDEYHTTVMLSTVPIDRNFSIDKMPWE